MPTLYLMVGLPRSGKSTWTEQNREGKAILSADTLRMMLYGTLYNPLTNPEKEKMVWESFDYLLRKSLKEGLDIIVDNTNTVSKRRGGIIHNARNAGYKVICIWVKTPADVCIKRTTDAGLIIAIERMDKFFFPPRSYEGFDEIIEIEG